MAVASIRNLKTKIQVVIVILLVIAIALQISMRKRSWLHSLSAKSVSNVDSTILDGFLMHSDDQKIAASRYTSTHSNTTQQTEVMEGLWCIDLVRRCSRHKAEQKPKLLKKPPLEPSLAMALPVLKGGYRKQHMSFVALVAMALSANQTILLESVKWSVRSSHNGIPFQLLVDTWNANPNLPKLVSYSPKEHSQWNPKTTMFYGTCPTVIAWYQSSQYTTFVPELTSMTAPYPAGGARPNQPGNLWDYYRKHDKYGLMLERKKDGVSISLQQLEEWILTSMTPSSAVQELVNSLKPTEPYMALHPRIEPEMLHYRYCQVGKVRRLQEILHHVTHYPAFAQFQQLFVAVAMPQMMERQRPSESWYKDHTENVQLLQTLFQDGMAKPDGSQLRVWTAGEASLEHRINNCMLTLLASVVNMELACQANVFIGTRVSTWSMSVWKIRHYRGLPNYEFTPTGIQPLEGLPPPFKC